MADKFWALEEAVKIAAAYASSGNAVVGLETVLERLYEKLKDHTMSDAYDSSFSHGYYDYEGDQRKNFFAYIRPSCAEWRQVLADIHRRIIERFPLDMILLDQHSFRVNDPGCDVDTAIPAMYNALAEATRPALLAGEGCHETSVTADVPMSVCTFDTYRSHQRPAWIKLHRISIELFRDYVIFCGHEGTLPSGGHKHFTGWPSNAALAQMEWTFHDQQERHRYLNLVPTVRITPRYGDLDEETAAIITAAAHFAY